MGRCGPLAAGRHQGATAAISLHLCHDHTPPWVEGFLHPAPASWTPYLPLLVFLSSACPGSCCPAESQENIGGEASFRGTRSGGSWPQGSAVCKSSRSGSICARVRSRVNLRHARRGLFFLYQGRAPSQELQPAG